MSKPKSALRQSTLDELFGTVSKKTKLDEGSSPGPSTINKSDTIVLPKTESEKKINISKMKSMGPELASLFAQRTPPNLGPIRASENHSVFIKGATLNDKEPPVPFPDSIVDKWDCNHVRMPCSTNNVYPVVQGKEGQPKLLFRWGVIKDELSKPINSSQQLQDAILSYNTRYEGKWKFRELHKVCNEIMTIEENAHFFSTTLPGMTKLAVKLPELVTSPIKFLKRGMNHSLTLSQEQIACLLAHAFFCTFPSRNALSKNDSYPEINFNRLLDVDYNGEKLVCILHYFKRVVESMPLGCVTFRRRCVSELPDWISCGENLPELHVSQHGTIEDYGIGMLQADFANKFVGGGVLGHGCVQEEIRFLICPEMIISKLFTQVLDDNECLVMTGCERFSYYSGYAETFKWQAPFVDETIRDRWGRRVCSVVAMDALQFYRPGTQYLKTNIDRELNKAYVSFFCDEPAPKPAVATGNWGCGVFGGDKQLKSLIQLLAAAKCGRDVVFFTFSDAKLMHDLYSIYELLGKNKVNVGTLYMIILEYFVTCQKGHSKPTKCVFDYVKEKFKQANVQMEDVKPEEELKNVPQEELKNVPQKELSMTPEEPDSNISRYCTTPDIDGFSSPEKSNPGLKSVATQELYSVATQEKNIFDVMKEEEEMK